MEDISKLTAGSKIGQASSRAALTALLALTAALGAVGAHAQDYPTRTIRIISPYPPGGNSDGPARLIANQMSPALGQSIVIENRPGAGGVSAVQEIMRAAPDGYTLIAADQGQWAITPALRPGVYDPVAVLAPITLLTTATMYFVVNQNFPARNLTEFVALIKQKPGAYQYGSSGNGTPHHLSMEVFKAGLGLDIGHIPYKGSAQSTLALLGGQVPIIVAGLASVSQHVKSGQVRLIAQVAPGRIKFTPEVPSVTEAGLTDYDFQAPLGLFATAGTPRAAIDKLNAAAIKALADPTVISRIEAGGAEPLTSTPEQLGERVRADVRRYIAAVKVSGAKID